MLPSPQSPERSRGVELARPLALAEAVERLGGRFAGASGARIERLVEAGDGSAEGDLVLVADPRWSTRAVGDAGWFLCSASAATRLPSNRVWIHDAPRWALAELLTRHVAPRSSAPAQVHATARVHASAELEPGVVIGARSVVEANVVLHNGVTLGDDVRVGAGSVVGRAGFGWAPGPDGSVRAIPHLGGVWVSDRVHVGALCSIDAGTLRPTYIGADTKIDSHVHVGHNVVIGARCLVAAQCGLAGSARLGSDVHVGGQAGFADHVDVGDGARIAAKSGVIGDVPAGATYAGYPAVARARWLRATAHAMRSANEAQETEEEDGS